MKLIDFLALMNNDLKNEWTHLQFYLYHASTLSGPAQASYREFLTDAAKSEMQHVQSFLDQLLAAGYTESPAIAGHNFPVFSNLVDILTHAVSLEETVVANYVERLSQLEVVAHEAPITARYLTIFYEDQLRDSYEDAARMRRMLMTDLQQVLATARRPNPEKSWDR